MWKFQFDELQMTLRGNAPALRWLTEHANWPMAVFEGSVLVMNLPGHSMATPGQLILTEPGEGGFVASDGVFWFIPNFWTGLSEVLAGPSGDLSIKLTDPSKVLIQVHSPDSLDLLSVLEERGPSQLGEQMGLFGRSRGTASNALSFPGNASPDLSQPGAQKAYFTYSPERRALEGIAAEDLSSYMDAGYATALGIGEDETYLAWGPVWVSRFDEDKQYEGTAVVTPESLLVWWQPSRRGLIHTFQASHSAYLNNEVLGPTAGHFHWDMGIYANDVGKHIVGDPVMYLAARVGSRDGHENRRALTVYWTFADRILN